MPTSSNSGPVASCNNDINVLSFPFFYSNRWNVYYNWWLWFNINYYIVVRRLI
jgi:hypothetical protein